MARRHPGPLAQFGADCEAAVAQFVAPPGTHLVCLPAEPFAASTPSAYRPSPRAASRVQGRGANRPARAEAPSCTSSAVRPTSQPPSGPSCHPQAPATRVGRYQMKNASDAVE